MPLRALTNRLKRLKFPTKALGLFLAIDTVSREEKVCQALAYRGKRLGDCSTVP